MNSMETILKLCDIIEQMSELIRDQQSIIEQSDIDMETRSGFTRRSEQLTEQYNRA